jgi:hypothetical protein
MRTMLHVILIAMSVLQRFVIDVQLVYNEFKLGHNGLKIVCMLIELPCVLQIGKKHAVS